MNDSRKVLFISIKPKYLKKILNQTKTIELRKSMPKVSKNDIVILYATTPIKAVLGYAYIQDILIGSPEEIWQLTKNDNGISKSEYSNYYDNSSKACGIRLKKPKIFKSQLNLDELRTIIPNFQPPQTYKYLPLEIFKTQFNRK